MSLMKIPLRAISMANPLWKLLFGQHQWLVHYGNTFLGRHLWHVLYKLPFQDYINAFFHINHINILFLGRCWWLVLCNWHWPLHAHPQHVSYLWLNAFVCKELVNTAYDFINMYEIHKINPFFKELIKPWSKKTHYTIRHLWNVQC